MTNREWLMSLSDKELGYVLFCGLSCDVACMEEPDAIVDGIRCSNCGADWLQSEYKVSSIPDDFYLVSCQNDNKPKEG